MNNMWQESKFRARCIVLLKQTKLLSNGHGKTFVMHSNSNCSKPFHSYIYVYVCILVFIVWLVHREDGGQGVLCMYCRCRCTEKYVFQQGMVWLLDYASNVTRMYNHVFLLPGQPCVSLSVHYLSSEKQQIFYVVYFYQVCQISCLSLPALIC